MAGERGEREGLMVKVMFLALAIMGLCWVGLVAMRTAGLIPPEVMILGSFLAGLGSVPLAARILGED